MAIIMLWETYPDPTNRDGLEMIGVPQTFPYFPCVFKRAHNFPQCFLANVWFCQYLFSQVFPHIFHIFHRSLQTFYTHIFSRYSTYSSNIFQIFHIFESYFPDIPSISPHHSVGFYFFLFFPTFFWRFPLDLPWPSPAGRPTPRPLCARRSWRSCCRVWRRSYLEVFRRGERWRRRGCLGLEMVVIFSGVSWELWGGVSCVFWGDFSILRGFQWDFRRDMLFFSTSRCFLFMCLTIIVISPNKWWSKRMNVENKYSHGCIYL